MIGVWHGAPASTGAEGAVNVETMPRASFLALVAALSATLPIAACSQGTGPLAAGCISRFDCDDDEVCSSGRCVAAVAVAGDAAEPSEDASPGEPGDGGMIVHPPRDAGAGLDVVVSPPLDGGTDAGVPDAAGGMPDATPPPVDAGPLVPDAGCAGPVVTIVGGGGYCTITAALNAASPGDTINVPAASFGETLDISKAVTLLGAGSGTAGGPKSTVLGPGTQTLVVIRASSVVVRGFELDANGGRGVELNGQAELEDVAITGAAGFGVIIRNPGSAGTFRSFTLAGVAADTAGDGFGVDLDTSTSAVIEDSEITDTYSGSIYAYAASVTLRNTRVLRGGRGGCAQSVDRCYFAVYADNNATLTISDGSAVRESGAAGIGVYHSAIDMRGSTSNNNGTRNDYPSDGIFLDAPTASTIINSTINNNRMFGIGCWEPYNVQQCSNNVHQNNGNGWTNCGGC